jgi:hypothetical protein
MASALQTIVVDVEKFFKGTGTDLEKFADAFAKWLKKAPTAIQAVDNFLGQVAPEVEAALALVDPVAEAPVAVVFSTVETALAAVAAAAANATSGSSLLANLENFASSVPALLTGIDVKNTALQAKVTKIVNLVVNETKVLLPAVESWVAQLSTKA